MEKQKTKREIILEKIDKRLEMIDNDPNILDYNYYNDKNFVGVKMTKETTGITLSSLSKRVDHLTNRVDKLADSVEKLTNVVIEGFALTNKRLDKLEDFAVKQLAFNEEQRKFNELLLSLPTIKKEIEEAKKKK